MKRGSGIKLIITLVLIAAAVFFSIQPIQENINLGLDLQGGASVLLQAIPQEGQTITTEDMEKLTAVMRNRVDEFGVAEPIIQREGEDRLIVELAGIENPDEAIEMLGKTARLEFKDPSGEVILTGADLANSSAMIDSITGQNVVTLEFTEEGAKKFASATARLVGQEISIYLDDALLQNPVVNGPILDGNAQIQGGFTTFEDAANIAALLRGGALPVDIEILSKSTVGPTLGQDSLDKSFRAIIIGLVALAVFMIAYYRLPGLLANISLIVYALLLLWILSLIHATLTLPGIAGFVLSMGMAVDSNIIIYERLKEELRAGKTLRVAVEAGFKRALSTILDANITTLIAALVLFQFGTGSIQGFALILAIGLVVSLVTAIFFTRMMLRWTVQVAAFNNPKLYKA